MKVIFSILFSLWLSCLSFANSLICPDPPINDDPCITSAYPPFDLTDVGSHLGTTCCARGPQDQNTDGSVADFENIDCSESTQKAAVWYIYSPNENDVGYTISLQAGGADPVEGPITIEVYVGDSDQGCNGGFLETLASSCSDLNVNINIGNCFNSEDIIFVKISTDDPLENCGSFTLSITSASCGPPVDKCTDLGNQDVLEPITDTGFIDDYFCIHGCLDFACPEVDDNGGCPEMTQMPTVWYQVRPDHFAQQMFTTVEPFGNWTPNWTVYSGPDCDNLTVVDFGGTPSCSNGDSTPELHQNSVFCEEENYWIAITIDPESLPASGLDNGEFQLCVVTVYNAIICLGELEGGACDDESLVMEITERELDSLPLDGPFAQGEEVTINISFLYDASDSGDDWLMGIVPKFGAGWDLENLDFTANAPVGNGIAAEWFEEGSDNAPVMKEDTPILCTYTDGDGNLQLCSWLCSPCEECASVGMDKGDPLPNGYFWVTEGTNTGCENDGSPGEGWGIGSIMAQVDWSFTISTKVFDSIEDCADSTDLSISFQTFSHGAVGCWEDPVGECMLDRMMFSPSWEIACEGPLAVNNIEQTNIHIHPNPSQDVFNIDFHVYRNVEYKVTDIMGRVIERGAISSDNMTINLEDEIEGVYFLILQNKSEKISTYHRLLKI